MSLSNPGRNKLIHRRRPAARTVEQLEYALFDYIEWGNQRRLHGQIGMRTPAEAKTTASCVGL
jgi:putative transposase